MLNIKLIYKALGTLLFIEAMMMIVCSGLSLYMGEDDTLAFIISTILTILGGIGLKYLGRDASNTLGRRDAYLLVTFTWVIFSLFGSFPFLISGYITNFTDAYFETMSGFTTTGSSIIDDVEKLPHGMLFWRSMTQWVGALGIVFFTIAIIPSLVGGNVKVFSAEATGPIRTKMHPRLGTTAKWIWSIYSLLTISCAVCFYLSGMGLFDCLNYSMTITATGGFSTHNASTGYFHSCAIHYTAIIFMFLSGTSFTLLYLTIFKWRIKAFLKNTEFRLYILLIVLATIPITYLLVTHNEYSYEYAFRKSLFQVVSSLTTTGIFNDNVGTWTHISWVIMGICMFIGGCAGSTSGGFKCVRLAMVINILRNEIKRTLHPKAILPVKINDTIIHYSSQVSLLAFMTMFMLMCVLGFIIMILSGIDSTNSIIIAISCVSNIGPSLDVAVGPSMSWTMLPAFVKWILCVLMLMGRLEIISVLVLVTPSFWKDH
ncbi:MAG: TrkH family potassium uptake protein [Prevotella sp.]|nr:TrkH family potassium uptake protein [Prevotella sp.]